MKRNLNCQQSNTNLIIEVRGCLGKFYIDPLFHLLSSIKQAHLKIEQENTIVKLWLLKVYHAKKYYHLFIITMNQIIYQQNVGKRCSLTLQIISITIQITSFPEIDDSNINFIYFLLTFMTRVFTQLQSALTSMNFIYLNQTYLMWGNMIIKKKRGTPEQQGAWGQWGQPQQNTGGWGQQNTGGWGQQPQQIGGWGQQPQQQNTGGWGQPQQQNTGGWGQQQNTGGWGQQPQQQNTGGWGQPQQQNTGGWGQPQSWGTGNIGFLNTNSTWGNQLQGTQWLQAQKEHNQFQIVNNESVDILKLIEQQITQVEPSPSKGKLEQLRKKGQQFIDDRFPPQVNSLSGEWGSLKEWKDIKWQRLKDRIPNGKIFAGKPQPQDIKQGYLGDCYFLAGLAALSQRPDRIYNLFLLQEKNELHYYSVKILFKGKWLTIDMDDYIPFLHNSPAFSKSVGDEYWVMLLQKAWAKLYTSYKRTEAGYPQEPLHDLTGAPIKQIFIKKGNANKEEQWQYLLRASQLEYSMVCSSNPGSDSDTSQSGVVQGHAYTLLNALYLNFQGQQIKLIQLRNPWGKGQYKGPWSDYDPNWNQVDPNQKKRIGVNENNKDDGIFFMTFDAFWAEFRSITIAQINDNASYLYKSFKDKNKEGCYFKVEIKKQGTYSLQVDKTPQRSFEDKLQNAYNYPNAVLELGFLNNNNIQKLQGVQSNARTTQQKYKMSPGTYIVKVRIDFDPQWQKDFDVNLAVYAQYPCVVTLASQQEATLFAGKQVSWKGQEVPAQNNTTWNNLGAFGYSSGNVQGNTWGQTSGQQHQGGWGTQEPNNWGQQSGNTGGWGQQPQQQQGGWGQQPQQQGGWGQQSGNTGGWGQQPQPQQQQQGSWGNNSKNNSWGSGGW